MGWTDEPEYRKLRRKTYKLQLERIFQKTKGLFAIALRAAVEKSTFLKILFRKC